MIRIQKQKGHGVVLPDLDIGLDVGSASAKHVFISHAHADHMPRSRKMEVFATPATSAFLQIRGFKGFIHELEFGKPVETERARITLFPAGHILGSAMIYVESDEGTLLYTGDFRTPASRASEGFECPERVDVLITEATFGLPVYRWKPHDIIFGQIRDFARNALRDGATPVFFCYNLGKAQEVMHALAPLGETVQIHAGGYPLCAVYEHHGVDVGRYEKLDVKTFSGKILIMPVGSQELSTVQELNPVRTAYVSGWAAVDRVRLRAGADEYIPLSDHVDFFELMNLCKALHPRHVYITHTPNPDVVQYYLKLARIPSSPLDLLADREEA